MYDMYVSIADIGNGCSSSTLQSLYFFMVWCLGIELTLSFVVQHLYKFFLTAYPVVVMRWELVLHFKTPAAGVAQSVE
jgi:hypothetical protein